MWKIVRRRDLLDEEPYWYVDTEEERDARVKLARELKCKPDDLKTIGRQPDAPVTRKGKRS